MTIIYTPFIWPLILASALMAGISSYVLRHKDVPAARPFSLMMAAGAGWAFTYTLAISTATLPYRVFLGSCALVLGLGATFEVLVMVIEYIGKGDWLTRGRLILLAILPAAIVVLAFTSPYHTLFRYNFRVDLSSNFAGLLFSTGPLYGVFVGYLILSNFISITLLFSSALRHRQDYWNTLLIALGVLFPLISGLLFAVGLSPIRGFDPGPIMQVFTGLFTIAGLTGGGFLDVAHVARDLVMENIEDIVIVLDTHKHIIDLNPVAKKVLGLPKRQYIDTTSETLPEEWADFFRQFPGAPVRQQEVTIGSGNNQRIYDLTISPIQDARLRQLGLLFLLHDVTDRKNIEEGLRESEEKFRRLTETAPTGMYIFDGTRFVIINTAFMQISGYSENELARMDPMDVVHPDYREMVSERATSRLKGDLSPLRYEVKILTRSHEEKWADLSLGVITFRGKPATLGTFIDITERKRTEEALFESESKMRAIADSAWDAILMMDSQGRVSYWNPAAERILGYTEDEAIGQKLHDLIAPQRYHEAHNAGFPSFVQTGQGAAIGNLHEIVARRKNGTEVPVQLSLSGFQLNGVWCAVGIISDISERKHLQDELKLQATVDDLTGITNRRHFLTLALGELKRALRLNHPLTVAMVDIDNFKFVNDTYGHAAGDQILLKFAHFCQKNIREIDVFARIGGDEFVILLPETNSEQAYVTIDRIRQSLATIHMDFAGKPISITISSGIASLKVEEESIDTLLSRADQALYQAKEAGRNRVVVDDLTR
jgi:diguanylate cyclase (GGDEF)-like protein/PAS domain S-box-containing protein